MTAQGQKALNSILKLDCQERAAIAAQLLASLDDVGEELDPQEWDRLWSAEVEQRISEIDSGKVQTIPGDIVSDRLRAIVRDAKLA